MLRAISTDTTHRRPAKQAHRARPAASRAEDSNQNETRRYKPMTKKEIVNETLNMLDEEHLKNVMDYAWKQLEEQGEPRPAKAEQGQTRDIVDYYLNRSDEEKLRRVLRYIQCIW